MNAKADPNKGFLPLLVEYREKSYAAGKIPGGFFKREGRPHERETLSARQIDRPLRPLFPEGFRNDVQIIASVLSFDQENETDILGIVGASAAMGLSEIPFEHVVSAVRVGRVGGQFVVNPTVEQIEESDMDVVVAGTDSSIVMVEGGCDEVSEADLVDALEFAHAEIKLLNGLQRRLEQASAAWSLPDAATTRWQGTTIGMGLCRIAWPAARAAPRFPPAISARSA